MKRLLAAIIVALASSAASADIIYSVNRAIGSGTVVGTITTDGILATPEVNIVSWSLELTSPLFSSAVTLFGTTVAPFPVGGGFLDDASAGALSESASGLTWDFGATGAYLIFYDPTATYWYCLETDTLACSSGPGEAIGAGEKNVSEGQVTIGTANNVPEPTGLALVALGLLGVGLSRRKQR